MLNKLNSIASIETVLTKLTIKQKQLIYQIARLDYRIFKKLAQLEVVNVLIKEEEENIKSLNTAIKAAGKGKVSDKLLFWKVKAEYKLFKFNLRKNKIDVIKLILNQSKLEQAKQALVSINADIEHMNVQKQKSLPAINKGKEPIKIENLFPLWESTQIIKEKNAINQSINVYLKQTFQMAS